MTSLLNFSLYQTGWFACVLGASWGYPWLGMSLALGLLFIHFGLASERAVEIKLSLFSALVGLSIDALQLRLGVFRFSEGVVVAWLPPPWMTVLWLQFATTFRYCLKWLSRNYLLCAVCGLLAAPLAFFAGERLGAIEFLAPRWRSYATLGGLWAISLPLIVWYGSHLSKGEPGSYRGIKAK